MKKNTAKLITVLICLTCKNIKAQSSINIFGTQVSTVHALAGSDKGYGFGVGSLTKGKLICDKVNGYRVLMQYSGDFFCSGLGKKTICEVPFITPVLDLSKVTISNSLINANIGVRFSFLNKSIFTSYISCFAGFRSTRSYITIKPNNAEYSYEGTKHELLAKANGFNFGTGWGIVTALSKRIKLDVGVTYQESSQNGKVVNLRYTCAGANGMNFIFKGAPRGIMTATIGMQFILNWSRYSVLENCNCPDYFKQEIQRMGKNKRGFRWN